MKKTLSSIFLLLSTTIVLFAQVSNDDCATAQVITIPSSGNVCITSTTTSASGVIYTGHPCFPLSQNIPDVWFTYIATGSSNTVTVSPTGTPAASRLGVTLNSGGCASTVLNTCNLAATNGGTASATWVYPIGTQVWINVGSMVAQGGFQLCVTSVTPPPAPGDACATATTLCSKTNFAVASFPNNVNAYTPSCFPTALQRPIFYQFTVGQSGTCIWTADPTGNAEYDWVLYDITAGCPGTNVCCNFNYANENGSPVGMATGGAGACGTSGFDGAPGEFSPPANLVVGNTYMLVIDNYSNNTVGFNFTWGGTFDIAPTAQFTALPATACGSANVAITNNSIASVDWDWNFGDGTSLNNTQNPPAHNYPTPGTYLISLVTTSATGCNDVASASVIVNPIPVVTPITNVTVCAGATIPASAFTSTPTGATFAWTNSNTATGLAAGGSGNYASFTATNTGATPITGTVTVTPTLNGCVGTSVTYTITVNPSITPTFTAVAPICSGAALAALPTTSNNSITGSWSPALDNTATTTYTFTPTAGQCALTTTLTVTVNPVVIPTFTAVAPICSGAALAALPTTSNNSITGSWSPALDNTTTTTYTFTPTAGQCATTTTLTITVGPPATPTFTAIAPICSGDVLTALPTTSNNSFTGTWSPALDNTATTTYTFTPTAGQCATTTTLTITVNPLPPVTVNSPSICPGQTATLTASGATSYTWSAGLSSTSGASVTGSPVTTTSYTVIGTDLGCSSTAVATITIGGSIIITVNDTTICGGQTATLTASGGTTYTWTAGLSSTTGSTVTGSPSSTTSYTVTGSTGGCSGTDVATITINPLPVLVINNPAAVCSPLTVDITAAGVTAGSTGGGTLSYWTNPQATNPLASPTSVSNSATYYIQSVTTAGCKDIQPVTVLINTTPVLTITDPAAVCAPNTVDITTAGVTAGSTGGGTLTYWTDATATTALTTPTAVGSGTYYIQASTVAGCTDIKPVTVTINALPVLTITNPAAVCAPNTVDITAANVTAGSTGSGTLSYWADVSATIVLPTPTAVGSGIYYIQSTTPAGCTDLDSVLVTINPLPVLSITNPQAVCSPNTVDITAINVTAGSTGAGVLTYWTDASATTSIPTPSAISSSGTYYIQSTTSSGCTDIDPVVVTINPLPVLSITDPSAVCAPNTIDITDPSVTAGSTGGGTLTYWSDATATTSLTTPTGISSSGTYYIQTTTVAGCTDIRPVVVTINPLPVPLFTADNTSGCSPICVNFTDGSSIASGTLSNWNWDFGGEGTSTSQNPSFCFTTPGQYTVTLSVTSGSGCNSQSNPMVITVFQHPVAAFSPTPNPASVLNSTVTLNNESSSDVTYWYWSFGDGDTLSPNTPSPTHTYPDELASTYTTTLIVQNANGCYDSVSHEIIIAPEFTFFIPNAFSPNGDGINDTFYGQGIGIEKYEIFIFDRWGNNIFYADDINSTWDGTANHGSEMAQQDVYIWKVKLKDVLGKKHDYIGTVTIVK